MEISMERELEINPINLSTISLLNYSIYDAVNECLSDEYRHENLIPEIGGQVSYYGKAKVHSCGDVVVLQSYRTLVAAKIGNKFYKLWDDWSATTRNHFNTFFVKNGGYRLNKKEWMDIPTYRAFIFNDKKQVVLI